MSKEDDARRLIADADDMAIGIGKSKLRFIGLGLLAALREEGLSDEEIWELLPTDGKAAYDRDALKAKPA